MDPTNKSPLVTCWAAFDRVPSNKQSLQKSPLVEAEGAIGIQFELSKLDLLMPQKIVNYTQPEDEIEKLFAMSYFGFFEVTKQKSYTATEIKNFLYDVLDD